MSSDGRKDLSSKIQEKITPDAMKSDTTKMKEGITGAGDHVAREVQPDSSKSGFQEAMDKAGRTKDNTKHGSEHETVGDKVKNALGMGEKHT